MYEQDISREMKSYSNVKFLVATELKCPSSTDKLANDHILSQFHKSLQCIPLRPISTLSIQLHYVFPLKLCTVPLRATFAAKINITELNTTLKVATWLLQVADTI
jgi:hypothetical protein